jgi:Ca2+-binding RTX toxin-like protein
MIGCLLGEVGSYSGGGALMLGRMAGMGKTVFCLLAAALVGLVLPAGSGAGDLAPTCHGKPATLVGTAGDDSFESGDFSDGDVVVLLGGDDRAVDFSQDVTICGNGGKDRVVVTGSNLGQQTLLDGGRGADRVGDVDSILYRGPNPLTLFGGYGDDILLGSGQDGSDPGGDDQIFAGPGADSVGSREGDDLVHGNRGNDVIFGDEQNDELYGEGGKDVLHGGSGNDYANGGPQFDRCGAETEVSCEASV